MYSRGGIGSEQVHMEWVHRTASSAVSDLVAEVLTPSAYAVDGILSLFSTDTQDFHYFISSDNFRHSSGAI